MVRMALVLVPELERLNAFCERHSKFKNPSGIRSKAMLQVNIARLHIERERPELSLSTGIACKVGDIQGVALK